MSGLVLNSRSLTDDLQRVQPGQIECFSGSLNPEVVAALGAAVLSDASAMGFETISGSPMSQVQFDVDNLPPSVVGIVSELSPILPLQAEPSVSRLRKFTPPSSPFPTPHPDGLYKDFRVVMVTAGEGEFIWTTVNEKGKVVNKKLFPIKVGDLIALNNNCPEPDKAPHYTRTVNEVTVFVYGQDYWFK